MNPPIASPSKILIAEDDPSLSMLLQFRLEKEGFKVQLAKDGKEAIEMIGDFKPDVLVSDIMMPNITGLELVVYVRVKLQDKVPIILLSNAGQDDVIVKAFDLGVNDFLNKPFIANELIIRIRKLLD